MSERTIALTRQALDAFNARDTEALIALLHPSVEVHGRFAGLGEVTIYQGHEGVRGWQADLSAIWEEIRNEPEAMFDLGERTLTFYEIRAKGRLSGAETAMRFASVTTWQDGLCVSLKIYRDREEALRELGVTREELEPITP